MRQNRTIRRSRSRSAARKPRDPPRLDTAVRLPVSRDREARLRRMEMSQRFSLLQTGPTEPPPGVVTTYTHPDEVLSDPKRSRAEKKALLASWISDARAVENAPTLRQLDSGAVVEVDTILRALVSLDQQASHPIDEPRLWSPSSRRRGLLTRWVRRSGARRGANDNDDDPPPAPAGFGIPCRPKFVAAHEATLRQPQKVAIA